jgi:CYTH domain-containing protein
MSATPNTLYINAEPLRKVAAGLQIEDGEWRYVVQPEGKLYAIAVYEGDFLLGYL